MKTNHERELQQTKAKHNKSASFKSSGRSGAQGNREEGIHVENRKIHKFRTSESQSSHLRPKEDRDLSTFQQSEKLGTAVQQQFTHQKIHNSDQLSSKKN